MLIFGNNNLVLNEGLTLNEEIAQTKDSNILALKKNKNYEKIEKNYNEDTFANIESFEVKKKPMPKCDNQNNAQYMKGIDVNKFVHDACLQSKYSAAQRKNNNSNNYDKVPTPSHPNVTKETLIQSKEAYKAGNMNMSNIKNSINRGIFNTEEANYITDGAYSN